MIEVMKFEQAVFSMQLQDLHAKFGIVFTLKINKPGNSRFNLRRVRY